MGSEIGLGVVCHLSHRWLYYKCGLILEFWIFWNNNIKEVEKRNEGEERIKERYGIIISMVVYYLSLCYLNL